MTRSSEGSLGLCRERKHGLGQQRGRADRRETAIEEEANDMMATRLAAGVTHASGWRRLTAMRPEPGCCTVRNERSSLIPGRR